MKRRAAEPETQAAAAPPAPVVRSTFDTTGHSALAQRRTGPHSREEVEERYIAARDAWTKAMRAASSGRSADLASLALAQETYEAATAERERWMASGHVAISIEPAAMRRDIEAAVRQELEWRSVRTHHEPKGLTGWLRKRLGR